MKKLGKALLRKQAQEMNALQKATSYQSKQAGRNVVEVLERYRLIGF